jgi:hypothetical protein
MSLLERLDQFKFDTKDHPDLQFLKNSEITPIISRGLSELYKIQPKNPITFLANWLLNESRSCEIVNKVS